MTLTIHGESLSLSITVENIEKTHGGPVKHGLPRLTSRHVSFFNLVDKVSHSGSTKKNLDWTWPNFVRIKMNMDKMQLSRFGKMDVQVRICFVPRTPCYQRDDNKLILEDVLIKSSDWQSTVDFSTSTARRSRTTWKKMSGEPSPRLNLYVST